MKPLLTQLTCIEVEFCIDEWSTGLFIKKSVFDEVENLSRYIDHFLKLNEWRSLNSMVVDKILQKKYDRMHRCVHHLLSFAYICSWSHGSHRASFGIVSVQHAPPRMPSAVKEAAMKELEGRTGETDSETEH